MVLISRERVVVDCAGNRGIKWMVCVLFFFLQIRSANWKCAEGRGRNYWKWSLRAGLSQLNNKRRSSTEENIKHVWLEERKRDGWFRRSKAQVEREGQSQMQIYTASEWRTPDTVPKSLRDRKQSRFNQDMDQVNKSCSGH